MYTVNKERSSNSKKLSEIESCKGRGINEDY